VANAALMVNTDLAHEMNDTDVVSRQRDEDARNPGDSVVASSVSYLSACRMVWRAEQGAMMSMRVVK
jgi:hypothetical protein